VRASIGCLLAGTLVLVACQAPGASGQRKPARPAESTALNTASLKPGTSNGTMVVDLLAAPKTPTTALTGTVQIDASYLVASSAGTIIAQGGGNIVAAGGGNVIGINGGNIVAAGGGNIVAAGGGNIIAQGGGNIVAAGGGNVIPGNASGLTPTQGGALVAASSGNIVAAGGGNIVAAGGGNIVAAGGGNIVAAGGGNYSLLAEVAASLVPSVAPSPIKVKPGTILAGAGMLVSAVSLTNHKYVPVGVNASGQPVYVVYSNAKGEYKLYLPKEEVGNVLIVTNVPGTQDTRVVYNVLTSLAKAQTVSIDEDTALAGRFLHRAFEQRLQQILQADDQQLVNTTARIARGLPDVLKQPLTDFTLRFNNEARKYGISAATDPTLARDLAQFITDGVLAQMDDLTTLNLEPSNYDIADSPRLAGPEEPALPALGQCLKTLREACGQEKFSANHWAYFKDPKFAFAFQDDCDQPMPTAFEVKMATDPGNYLVEHFLTKNVRNEIYNTDVAFKALDKGDWDGHPKVSNAGRAEAASLALLSSVMQRVALPGPDQTKAIDDLNTFCRSHGLKEVPLAPRQSLKSNLCAASSPAATPIASPASSAAASGAVSP
jgi:hypothetical protein